MKIAFYHRNVCGGIKTHVDALSYEFERLGHEVKNIDQYSLGSYMLGNPSGGISYGFDFGFSLKKIKREVEDCDILHIHHAATSSEFFLPFSSICSELNIVNTFHIAAGDGLSGELAKALIGALASLYAGRSKKFISVSEEIAADIRRYTQGYGDNGNGTETVVIPNGVDINRFYPHAPEQEEKGNWERENEKGVCIGYLGRLSTEKNLIAMIKAVKALKSDKIRLKIAGDGPLYDKIKKKEGEKIEVLGYVEDAPAFYRNLDVFLLPSKLEAQPIALLEAMASGLPVIATDVGDNKYFVRGNGILCGTTAKEIGAAIKQMLKEDMEKMGIKSRKIVERDYTWDKIAKRTLEVYKSVITSQQAF